MVPIIPVLILGALAVVHAVPGTYLALLPLPIMLIFLGWAPHNDVAYDGTAIWLHVVSGTAGLADRIGRLVPVLCIGIPLIAVGTAVSVGLYGDVAVLPAMLGVCLCELLVGLGLSSVTSALVPYPVAKPGDSPFQQPQSVGAVAGVVQGFSLVVILVLSAPSIVFAVLGVFVDPAWFLPSFLSGVLIGGAAAVGGVWGGAAIFNRRGPEVLESALRAA
jgi:ABC-2 type transport system permease protein